MRAAIYKGKQLIQVEEVPTPKPDRNQLLVKVNCSAICGTDVHAFLYDIAPPGKILGHEFCGTVASVGSSVSKWRTGDRVIGGGGIPPNGMEPATRTHPRFNYRTMGMLPGMGGSNASAYAEYTIMEEWAPISIPDRVPDETAALTEPCAVAIHAVRQSRLNIGDSVGILGAGPIGLLCIQVAKAAGAGTVLVSEPALARSQAAAMLGADAVINPNLDDATEKMVQLTGGLGPDVIFDCAGIGTTLDQAMNTVRRGGQVVLVAVPWEPMPLMPVDWMTREVSFQSSWGSLPEDWQVAVQLFENSKVSIEPLISDESFVPLEDIQQTFEALIKPSTQLQMIVRP